MERSYSPIYEVIDSVLTRTEADPDLITEGVMLELGAMTKARILEVLDASIYDTVRQRLRSRVKYVEEMSGNPANPTKKHGHTTGVPEDPEIARKSLLDERFYSPAKKRYVTWGEAHVEDHVSYAEMLRGQMAGIELNAIRHEQAADAIRKAHVTCLDQLSKKKLDEVLA